MKDEAPQRVSAHLSLTTQADASMHCVTEDIDEFRATLNSVFYPAHVDLIGGREPGLSRGAFRGPVEVSDHWAGSARDRGLRRSR